MIIKNTGWKNPGTISQYNKYYGKVCSTWSRLEKAKVNEPKSKTAPYDLCAVCYNLTDTKRSALMYIYNFNFNIPSNATINKVLVKTIVCQDDITISHVQTQILKLKTGASLTDSGVGNNLAPMKPWRPHKDAYQIGMQETTIGNTTNTIKETWGVNLTPAMLNNNNFGCVFQCMADGKQKHKAYVDSVQMYVEYSLPSDTNIVKPTTTIQSSTIDTKLSAVKYNTLNPKVYLDQSIISQSYDNPAGYHFWIKYTNKAFLKNNVKVILNQNSNPVILETDGLTLFSGGTKSITVPSQLIKGTSDTQYFKSDTYPLAPDYIEQFYDVYVFSNITDFNKYDTTSEGYIESTVTLYSTKISNGVYVKKDKLDSITFKLNNTTSNIANSQTIIEDCTFINNKANKGAAIYNIGRLYIKEIKMSNNITYGENKNNCQFYDVNICRDKEFS